MEIANRFGNTLASSGSSDTQPGRRELTRAVIALDPVVDEAIGESSRLRYHSPVLQAAIEGLLAALAAWRIVAVRLTRLPDTAAQSEAEAVLRILPEALRSGAHDAEPTFWLANPTRMRRLCETAAGTLNAMPTGTPSLRLLADQTARVLAGLSDALRGLALLGDDLAQPRSRHQRARLHVPDWLPAFVNAGRAFAIIGAVEVFWIVTAWPNGAFAITWTAIPVLLFSPTADQGYARATSFMMGSGLAVVCAAIVLFAVLPNLETFAGFSMAIGLYLVPVGALMAQAWHTAMFIPMAGNFVPLLGPANQMAYDTVGFYNSALAIFAGCAAAALSFRLLPPLSPALQTQRLLALSSHDLRRLATDVLRRLPTDWEGRLYSRIAALPDAAEPLHRAQLLAALSVGTEIMHLRRVAAQLGVTSELDAALEPFARGDSVAAIARLERLDRRLASCPESDPQTSAALHERARILLICDALVEHRAYFDGGEAN